MFRRFSPNYMLALYVLDLSSGVFALWAAGKLRLVINFGEPITEAGARVPASVFGLVLLTFGILLPMAGQYDARKVFKAVDEAQRAVLGVIASGLVLAGTLYLTYRELSRLIFVYFILLAIMTLIGSRIFLRIVYRLHRRNGAPHVKVLIAGAGRLGREAAKTLDGAGISIAGFVDDDPSKQGTHIEGYPVFAPLDAIPDLVARQSVTDVVFALPRKAYERMANLLVALWGIPLRISMIPDFFDLGFPRAQVEYLGGLTVVGLREPVIDNFQRVAKRLLDLIVGSAILICGLPVMAIIALAVWLESPGPVLFRQQRVGENGRLFTIFKFRTMVTDAEQRQTAVNLITPEGKIIHKRPDDPRVTRVGKWLRWFSLDELPQLINVLRGEMSLVGPRPEMPWIVAQYEPWQYQRLAVPQGMTSWYVVNGRSEIPMHLNTEEDLRYIREYSLYQDLKILWKSVAAVLKRRGAF